MKYIESVFYALQCDYPGCTNVADDGEYTFWSDKDSARQNAEDSQWLRSEDGETMYCWNHEDQVHWTEDEMARYIELPDTTRVEIQTP